MANGSYSLGSIGVGRGRTPKWLYALLVFTLLLVVVALVLAAVALAKMPESPSSKATAEPTTTPRPEVQTYAATLHDNGETWDNDYRDLNSVKSQLLIGKVTKVIEQGLRSKYSSDNYDVQAKVNKFEPSSTGGLILAVDKAAAAHVVVSSDIFLTRIRGDQEFPQGHALAAAINDYATREKLDISASVTEVLSTTPVTTIATTTTHKESTTATQYHPDWYKASSYLESSMNTSYDPCENFFDYVCANWIAHHPRTPQEEDELVFSELQKRANHYIDQGISGIKDGDVSPLQQSRWAYLQCNDSSNRDQSINKIIEFVENAGGLPLFNDTSVKNDADLSGVFSLLGKLFRLHGVKALVEAQVNVDVGGDVQRNALLLNQGNLLMFNRDFYLNDTFAAGTEKAFKKNTKSIVLTLAKAMGIGNFTQDIDDFVNTVYNVERDIAQISLPLTKLRDHAAQYAPVSVNELNTTFNVNLKAYVAGILTNETQWLLDEDHYVIISQTPYFKALNTMLSKYTAKDITNYLVVRLLYVYGGEIDGSTVAGDRDCAAAMVQQLPWSTGRIYIDANGFNEESRDAVNSLVSELRIALNDTMRTVDFLDEGSRENATRKVDNIKRNPGYPEWILNDERLAEFHEGLEIDKDEIWATTMQTLFQWNSRKLINMLNSDVDRHYFLMSPAWVNAWYIPEFNSITFPAAILQPPFYRTHGPMSLNFGAIGTVIGHELTHGFDDEGVQYDWYGRLDTWMDKSSSDKFTDMAECIADEYSQFYFNDSGREIHLNGKTNQGENIADNGGIRQSLKAYRTWALNNPEPPLPGFGKQFTHDQLFFIGFANVWCGTETKQFDEKMVLSNPHSPPRFRVLGTLRNLDEFASAFKCKSGTMDPPEDEKCYVWANKPSPKSTTPAPLTTTEVVQSTTQEYEPTASEEPENTTTSGNTTSPSFPQDWTDASNFLESAMNLSVNPCENFYHYVCGNWIKSHPLGPGEPDVLVASQLKDEGARFVEEGLKNVRSTDIRTLKLAKTVYNICNTTDSTTESSRAVLRFMDALGGFPFFKEDWNKTGDIVFEQLLGKLYHNYGVSPFVIPQITADNGGDVSKNILYLNQAFLNFPSPYYTDPLLANDTRSMLRDMLGSSILKFTNASEHEIHFTEDLDEIVETIFEVERDLARILMPAKQARNHSAQYNPYDVKLLNDIFPAFDWKLYLQEMLTPKTQWVADDGSKVVIAQLSYFENLDAVMSKYTNRELVNYLFAQLIFHYHSEVNEIPKDCPSLMVMLMPWATGRIYVEANGFGNDSRNVVDEMVKEIQSALHHTMASVDILDEESRKGAIRKVENIVRNPGYPAWLFDDDRINEYHQDLEIAADALWINTLQTLTKWFLSKNIDMLNEPVDRHFFQQSPAVVNAWYSPVFNSITFPAAILQPPIFRPHGPMSLNFGAVGTVIGHELTHGFDDQGIQFDWYGHLRKWMDEKSRIEFRNMADCIVEEYGQFCFNDTGHKYCLNGYNTQGENIADNGGIRQSLHAYKTWSAANPEPPLPGFGSQFTHEQLFFIGFTSFWCGTESKAFDETMILTNPHSPPRFRVLGTLRNLDEFASAFGCTAGKMDPPDADRCYVWANQPDAISDKN